MSYREREGWRRIHGEDAIDLATFRKARGEQLEILCGQLASWKFRPEGMEVYVPSEDDPLVLRAELVKSKEILSRKNGINPEQVIGAKMHRDLRKHVPTIEESITNARIASLTHNQNAHGGHFLSFVLDDENATALGVERNRIWHVMELSAELPSGSSNWQIYNPFIDLAYIPPQAVPDATVEELARVFGGLAKGLPLQLGPVELPTA